MTTPPAEFKVQIFWHFDRQACPVTGYAGPITLTVPVAADAIVCGACAQELVPAEANS